MRGSRLGEEAITLEVCVIPYMLLNDFDHRFAELEGNPRELNLVLFSRVNV